MPFKKVTSVPIPGILKHFRKLDHMPRNTLRISNNQSGFPNTRKVLNTPEQKHVRTNNIMCHHKVQLTPIVMVRNSLHKYTNRSSLVGLYTRRGTRALRRQYRMILELTRNLGTWIISKPSYPDFRKTNLSHMLQILEVKRVNRIAMLAGRKFQGKTQVQHTAVSCVQKSNPRQARRTVHVPSPQLPQ